MALDWFTALYQCFKGFISGYANAKQPVPKKTQNNKKTNLNAECSTSIMICSKQTSITLHTVNHTLKQNQIINHVLSENAIID